MLPATPHRRFIFRTCLGGRQVPRISPHNTKTSSLLNSQKTTRRRFGGIGVIKIAMPDPTLCPTQIGASRTGDPYV